MIRWGLSQPARRDAALSRILFGVADGLFVVFDLLLQASELVDRRLALRADLRTLRRVVPVHEIGGQRVDAGLQRVGIDLIALSGFAQSAHPLRPVRLAVFVRLLVVLARILLLRGVPGRAGRDVRRRRSGGAGRRRWVGSRSEVA